MTLPGNNNIRTFGTLSYGDVTGTLSAKGVYEFPPTYTLQFNTKPVMSDNGISVKYNRNELTVTWVLPYQYLNNRFNPGLTFDNNSSPKTIDTAVQQIRSILMEPRKELVCTYQGLGPTSHGVRPQAGKTTGMVINQSNDVNYGPIPLDFKWRNIASQQAVEMTWVVIFHTHNQIIFDSFNDNLHRPTAFTELSWSRTFDIDELGSTTITTTGKYSIVSYNLRTITDDGQTTEEKLHSDNFRVVAGFPVPLYCQRISQRFQHDPTATSTTFTIVDKQHPTENALPPKCLKMDLTHEVSSAIFGGRLEGKGFHQWNNVIQGSITLPPGEPFITAYLLFWFYARQRLFRTEKGGIAFPLARLTQEKLDVAEPSKKTEYARNILTKVSYKESLFDRTHNFRIEYVGVYDRDYLIQQSGLFTPLYNYKENSGGEAKPWDAADTDPKNYREPWSADFGRPVIPEPYPHKASLGAQWQSYRNQFGANHPDYRVSPRTAWNVYGYVGMNENDVGPFVFYPKDQLEDKVRINTVGPATNDNAAGYLPAWAYPADSQLNKEQPLSYNQPDYGDLDPARSYIAYDNNFNIIEDIQTFQTVRQSYDPNIALSMRSGDGKFALGKSDKIVALHNATYSGNNPSNNDYVSGYNSQPTTTILMTGYAIRAGFPPVIPSAFHYRNTSLIRSGQSNVTVKQVAKGAIPVYLATWSIPYYANTSVHTNFFADLESTAFTGDLT